MQKLYYILNIRGIYLSNRVTDMWNELLENVVMALALIALTALRVDWTITDTLVLHSWERTRHWLTYRNTSIEAREPISILSTSQILGTSTQWSEGPPLNACIFFSIGWCRFLVMSSNTRIQKKKMQEFNGGPSLYWVLAPSICDLREKNAILGKKNLSITLEGVSPLMLHCFSFAAILCTALHTGRERAVTLLNKGFKTLSCPCKHNPQI